jgi:voltage-gated potassium channel
MKGNVLHIILRRLAGVGAILLFILIGGSLGYYFLGHRMYSLFDCFYMTVITITTIGYGEIIDLSASPIGRGFTLFVALAGIGTLTYTFSMVTALVVEGNLTDSFRRKKMEKQIEALTGHHIVCSAERVGTHIVNELAATQRSFVVIENHQEHIDDLLAKHPGALYVLGDPTDNEILLKAGIERAVGLFATEDDDNSNLVICLSAQHLKPGLRVIAHAREPKNVDKMKRAGASSVISAEQIGGLRMASEMTRPSVVSFLDIMLRNKEKNLRIEEVAVPAALAGEAIRDLKLKRFRDLLLMALREGDDWVYNPTDDQRLTGQSVLIFMGTPAARMDLEKELKGIEG